MSDGFDLGDLSSAYRHRPITESGAARARLSAAGRSGVVVDVGGGTGAHAVVFREAGMRPVVVDLNEKMCRQAAASGIPAVQASSAALPIRRARASLVYFHLSIHYGDWRQALDEALRVVAPGGSIDVWTFDEQGIRSSSLARWFPTVGDIDSRRFPDPGLLADHLATAGAVVRVESHPDGVERRVGDWAAAVRARFVSTLQMIDPDEMERGLAEFARLHPDPDGVYRYELAFKRIAAIA